MQNQFIGTKPDDRGNYIHPLACIGQGVTMGWNNYIGPYCLIEGETRIGDGNRFEAYCSIGTAPEHKDYWGKWHGYVIIQNRVTVREYVTINAGTHENTLVCDDVVILRGAHVGHDAWIEKGATISCNALIGGHAKIGQYANLGLGCIIHQHQLIEQGGMIGMGAVVTKTLKTKPYYTYVGNPARELGPNTKHPNYTIFMKQMEGEHE